MIGDSVTADIAGSSSALANEPLFVESAQDDLTTQLMAEALQERGLMPATMNQAQQAETIDQQIMSGAAKPTDYDFANIPVPAPGSVDPNQYNEIQSAFRGAMHEAGLPVGIGNEVARLVFGAVNKLNGQEIPQYQIDSEYQSSMQQLQKMYGPEFKQNIEAAKQILAKMDERFPMSDALWATGLDNSPWLIASLVNVAKAKGLVK